MYLTSHSLAIKIRHHMILLDYLMANVLLLKMLDQLSPALSLDEVLHVPKFHVNLIFVSMLMVKIGLLYSIDV